MTLVNMSETQADENNALALSDEARTIDEGTSVETVMTSREAYLAMYAFLDAYYRRGKFEETAVLLGALAILPDGSPANPAFKKDWDLAVATTLGAPRTDDSIDTP